MKVMLINPATEKYTHCICTPLGLLSIATHLNNHGHNAMLLERTVRTTDFNAELDSFQPDVIGVSVYSLKSFNDAIFVSKVAKQRGILVVWGGAFISASPQMTLDLGCIDYISIGEGEATWLDFCNTYDAGGDISAIKGLAYLKNGKLIMTPQRDFIDLASLTPIDFSLLEIPPFLHTEYSWDNVFAMYMSKGCFAHCTFCYNTAMHHNTYRRRPVEHFIEEITDLVNNHGVRAVSFADELFCRNSAEAREFCDAVLNCDVEFTWGCMMRTGILSKDDLAYMYKAGCRWIEFGVESGSPEVLKKIKKCVDYGKIVQTFEDCWEVGIITLAYFIVGFPDETPEQLRETVALAKRINRSRFVFSYYIPLPGSDLFNELVDGGKYSPPLKIAEYAKTKLFYSPKPNLSKVPAKDLKVIRSYFLWNSFSRREYAKEHRRFAIARKDIEDAFEGIFRYGFKAGIPQFFISAYEFLDIWFYANFFPGIKKKYDLNQGSDQAVEK